MIRSESSFIHQGLAKLWKDPESKPPKLDSTLIKRCSLALSHLETAENMNDLATGFGVRARFHRLQPANDERYSLDVSGNYRITFRLDDKTTGEVSRINLEDTH